MDAEILRNIHHGAGIAPGSLTVYMDTTNRCNLRCRMCYFSYDTISKRPPIHMPVDKFERIAAQVFPFAGTVFLSASSEPLQHPGFLDILRIASHFQLKSLKFLTNGQSLNETVARCCVDSGVTEIHVSVDGATASTYEWIRRGASFERLIRNLETLAKVKRDMGTTTPILQFNVTLMRCNADQLGSLVRLARQLGGDRLAIRHMVSYADLGMEEESLYASQAWANEQLQKGLDAIAREGVSLVVYPELFSGETVDVPPWTGWTEEPPSNFPRKPATSVYEWPGRETGKGISGWLPARFQWKRRFAQVVRQPVDGGPYPFGRVDVPEGESFLLRDGMECAGWALHTEGVERVTGCREPLGSERTRDLNRVGLVVLGEATSHVGSRPDVAAAYPGYRDSNRSGWTFRLFDKAIPKTSEAISLHFVAYGRDGQHSVIGSRHIKRDEHSAEALPFCARPFTCLYVDPLGNAFPHPDCQIPDPFGTFDQELRFEDLWQSPRFVELRERILGMDPPEMCRACPDFINRHVDDPAYFADRHIPH